MTMSKFDLSGFLTFGLFFSMACFSMKPVWRSWSTQPGHPFLGRRNEHQRKPTC